jgi:hypothetical protein
MAKQGYELKANFNSAEVAVGDKLIRLEEGKGYETSDPAEQGALDNLPSVKRAEKGKD